MQTPNPSLEEEAFEVRKLEISDEKKGFVELLQQLTVCDSISDEAFNERFREVAKYGNDHLICVIEDKGGSGKIIATGSVFIEKKFIRNCGKVGHIEDVVVDSNVRGKHLVVRTCHFMRGVASSRRKFRCLNEDKVEAALLLAQAASSGKGTSPLVHLLGALAAGLVAAVASLLLLLGLPHGVLDGFAAALLTVHLLQLLAALLEGPLLGVGEVFLLELIRVWAAPPLLQEALAAAELLPLYLLAALPTALDVLFVHGNGGHGGGVAGGAGHSHQGHQESCCQCYLDRHWDDERERERK